MPRKRKTDRELLINAMRRDSERFRNPSCYKKLDDRISKMDKSGHVIKRDGPKVYRVSNYTPGTIKNVPKYIATIMLEMESRMKSVMWKYVFDNLYRHGRARVVTDKTMTTYSIKELKGFSMTKFKRLYGQYTANKIKSREPGMFSALLSLKGLLVTKEPVPADILQHAANNSRLAINDTSPYWNCADVYLDQNEYVMKYSIVIYEFYMKYREFFSGGPADAVRKFVAKAFTKGSAPDKFTQALTLMEFMVYSPDMFYEDSRTEWLVAKSKNLFKSDDAQKIEFWAAFFVVVCRAVYGADNLNNEDDFCDMVSMQRAVEKLYTKTTGIKKPVYERATDKEFFNAYKNPEFANFMLYFNNKLRGDDAIPIIQ